MDKDIVFNSSMFSEVVKSLVIQMITMDGETPFHYDLFMAGEEFLEPTHLLYDLEPDEAREYASSLYQFIYNSLIQNASEVLPYKEEDGKSL